MRVLSAIAALLALALGACPAALRAELVVDSPARRWQAGERVELVVRGDEIRRGVRVDRVLFDGRPIPFELIGTSLARREIRLWIQVPATARPGGTHPIAVETSRQTSVVPEVVGLAVEQARGRLAARGLRLDAGAPAPERGGPISYTVARQSPRAGAVVPLGSRIAVEVASITEVPEIVGLAVTEARQRLVARSLEPGFAAPEAGPVAWRVETVDPPAGSAVPVGTRISAELVGEAPAVHGLALGVARSLLARGGLVPRTLIHPAAAGPYETVLAQEPPAGRRVRPGDRIAVVSESRPDPPPPRWPWPWLMATAGLSLLLRHRLVRRKLGRSFRVEMHQDIDRLRERAAASAADAGPVLDLRLLARMDPGRQALECHGPLFAQEVAR